MRDLIAIMLSACGLLIAWRSLLAVRAAAVSPPLLVIFSIICSISNQAFFTSRSQVVFTCIACLVVAVVDGGFRARHNSTRPNIAAILAFMLAVELFLVDAFASGAADSVAVLGRVLPIAVMAVIALSTRTGTMTPQGVGSLISLGVGYAFALTAIAPNAWSSCTIFKCGDFGTLLIGAFQSENFLGAVAGLGAISGLLLYRENKRFAIFQILVSLLVIIAADSRTSQLALLVSVAATLIVKTFKEPTRKGLASVMPAAFAVGGVVLVYISGPLAFSNRGSIWNLGTQALGDQWPIGRGISTWSLQVLARNFMHSQALLLLYSGGLLATLLYVACLTICLARSASDLVLFSMAIFIVFRGLTEVIWNPVAFDGSFFLFLPLLLTAAAVTRPNDQMGKHRGGPDLGRVSVSKERKGAK